MHRIGIENIRAEDAIVLRVILPRCPVGGAVLDCGDRVPLCVLLADMKCELVAIRLNDAGAERCGDDPR